MAARRRHDQLQARALQEEQDERLAASTSSTPAASPRVHGQDSLRPDAKTVRQWLRQRAEEGADRSTMSLTELHQDKLAAAMRSDNIMAGSPRKESTGDGPDAFG